MTCVNVFTAVCRTLLSFRRRGGGVEQGRLPMCLVWTDVSPVLYLGEADSRERTRRSNQCLGTIVYGVLNISYRLLIAQSITNRTH